MEYVVTVNYSSGIGAEQLIFNRLDWAVVVAKTITDRGDKAAISLI